MSGSIKDIKTLAFLINSSDHKTDQDQYQTKLKSSIIEAAEENNTNIICYYGGALSLSTDTYNDEQSNIIYELIDSDKIDGIIVGYTIGSYISQDEFRDFLDKFSSIPYICVPELPLVPSISADNSAGFIEIIEHLILVHNHKKIAYISGPENNLEAASRSKTYRSTLKKHSIDVDEELIFEGDFLNPSGKEAVRVFLDERGASFDAIVAANDNMAIGAIEELQSRGIKVPEDIAITGFDDTPMAYSSIPSLTTVKQPISEMGREAVNQLLSSIKHEKSVKSKKLATEIKLRESCGCYEKIVNESNSYRPRKNLSEIKNEIDSYISNISSKKISILLKDLIDNFFKSLDKEKNSFIFLLDKTLREFNIIRYDPNIILTIFTRVSLLIHNHKIDNETIFSAMNLIENCRIIVHKYIEKNSILSNQDLERKSHMVFQIGQSIIDRFDIENLTQVVIKSVKDLGIDCCYLALYKSPKSYKYGDKPPKKSEIILALRDGIEIILDKKEIDSKLLIPKIILPKNRTFNLIVMPLFFNKEQLGYLVLEGDNVRGTIYNMLQGQISGALKGAKLIEDYKHAEKELKHHRDNLDNEVKKRTAELYEINLELKESEENLKFSQQIAKMGNWKLDKNRDFLYLSEESAKIFDFPQQSQIRFDDFLSRIHEDERNEVKESLKNVLDDSISTTVEYRYMTTSGKEKWIFATQVPSPNLSEDGSSTEVVGIALDITLRKEAEQQLNQSRKMDSIGLLAGGVAHDFNNMLSGILSAAQLLKSPRRKLDRESEIFVDWIIKSTNRAADLTSKLLAFGRKGKIVSIPVDFHEIIEESKELLARTLDKKILLKIKMDAENHTVIGDYSALQNILINLGINASHAMPDGGVIEIKTTNINLDDYFCKQSIFELTPGNFILIEVSDSGNGISKDNIEKIFEPFFTTKDQGKGTGLGLAAVYGTVKNHNGAITVFSEPNEGTKFDIFLPCTKVESMKNLNEKKIITGYGKILLADDEEVIRITGKHMLENMGYSVELAKNGEEAVSIYKSGQTKFDLAILDMIMPKMNGKEAFFEIQEFDPNSNVIISSDFTRKEKLTNLKNRGLKGFISKPFKDYELSILISECLRSRKWQI